MTSFGRGLRTLTVVKKIVSIGLLSSFALILFSPNAFAQGGTGKKTTSSKMQQKLQSPESNFSFTGRILQSKPMREEMHQATLSRAALAYKYENSLAHESQAGITLEHAYVWSKYKEESQSQLDTATLNLERNSKLSEIMTLNYGMDIGLPANQADSTAGFNGSVGVPVTLSWDFPTQAIAINLTPTFYSYKYKTSTEGGDEYNKKISGQISAAHVWKLGQRFSWTNQIGFFEYQNYFGKTYQSYFGSSLLRFKMLKELTLVGGVVSQDRVVTTNSVLADDITAVRAGIEWSL